MPHPITVIDLSLTGCLVRCGTLLKSGAILEIRITAPGKIGKVFRYKMRLFRLPRELTRTCLQPGAKKRSSCPT